MRHGKKFNHLSRKPAHRKAMLSNMACSLIQHKRINTTVAKAKALRKYVEPLISKSKLDTTHSRRTVFTKLKSKDAVSELFREVAPKVADRPGGFTRIIRTGFRLGDAAEMCMIELVDFNDMYTQEDKKKTRRSRRGGAKKKTTSGSTEEKATAEKTEDAPKAESKEAKAETKTAEKPAEEKKEAPKSESKPEAKAAAPKEEKAAEPKAEEKKEDDSKKSEPKSDASKEEKKDDKSDEKKDDKKGE